MNDFANADRQLVDQLYQILLGRKADDAGLLSHGQFLAAQNRDEAIVKIVRTLQSSSEFKAHWQNKFRADSGGSPLLPRTLHPPLVNRQPHFVMLGTCIAEGFSSTMNGHVDHFIMGSETMTLVPPVQWRQYDGVIVHVTLRHILNEIFDNPDLDHVRAQSSADFAELLKQAEQRLTGLVEKVKASVGNEIPVFFLAFIEPPCAYQGTLLNSRAKSAYRLVREINDKLSDFLECDAGCYYIEVNDVISYYGTGKIVDSYQTHFTHAAFGSRREREVVFEAIYERVSNALITIRSDAPVKIIITDLDNTLWKGVLAEYDSIIPHEHTEGWPLGYVESLLEFKRRGGLLAISSKNNHAETLSRFAKVWRGRLSIEDFCSVKINWQPKSKNIAEILAEANLLPSNALFVDDNPREIEEVSRVFPDLRTLTGQQDRWRNEILYSPYTQVARISAESAVRTELIVAKKKRDELAGQMDRDNYLASLSIRVKFSVVDTVEHVNFARSSELVNKTNQFNTTGRRYSQADFDALFSSGAYIIATFASDKFGENGLIAVAIVQGSEISQVVMSCRVFGFGIEFALLSRAMKRINGNNRNSRILAKYFDTGRNKSSASFYQEGGFTAINENVWARSGTLNSPAWIQVDDDAAVS